MCYAPTTPSSFPCMCKIYLASKNNSDSDLTCPLTLSPHVPFHGLSLHVGQVSMVL